MLKLLFDNNISYRIKKKIAAHFPHVIHLTDTELSASAIDTQIWEWAEDNGYIIVSQDDDFKILSNMRGFPPKVIHLQIGNQSTQFISNLLIDSKEDIEVFYESSVDGLLEIIHQ